MHRSLISLFLALLTLSACSGGSGGQSATADSTAVQTGTDNGYNPQLGTVIWDGAGIYKDYAPKLSEWQTRLTAGEVVSVLDQTEAELDGKKTPLTRVRQPDTGKEGWLNGNFVVPASKVAAVLEPSSLYSRPALTAEEKKQFAAFDIVAVTAEKEDWVRVTGKRADATWMDADKWIKARAISYDRVDLDVAVLVQRALKEATPEKKLEALNKIAYNNDLSTTKLSARLADAIRTLMPNGGEDDGGLGDVVPDTTKKGGK
jgi:hypothetical protein